MPDRPLDATDLHAVPTCAHNVCRVANLGSDNLDLLLRHTANVHFDMKGLIDAKFGDDSPWQDIQILESLEHSSDGAGIRVGDDSESE
jgi:hypothetical protein